MFASFVMLATIAAQALPGVSARDRALPASASGTISGRVSEQGSGRPLPGALVTLLSAGRSEPRQAIADAAGRYEFRDLEPGDYALWAGPGELLATHLRQAFGQPAPLNAFTWSQPPAIALKAGEVRPDVDIALRRALAIEGRVSDPWDEPVANAEVNALRAGTRYGSQPVYTDERGEFRLFGLAPGRYRVCALPRRFFVAAPASDRSRLVRTCHLATTAESSAADVVLDTEDATGIDIRVQSSASYSVSGSILDAAGLPVDGGFVGATDKDYRVGANATAHAGQFVLTGLTSGRYYISASVGGPANPSDTRPPAR